MGDIKFRVFDVGGQRAERRKWVNCFDNVTSVIFLAAISEYDQVLFEDTTKNRLEEAVELFDEVCKLPVFKKIPLILFLNKKGNSVIVCDAKKTNLWGFSYLDLFEKKLIINQVPLNVTGKFPSAPKGD